MFLPYFNVEQKRAFWKLANDIVMVDGVLHESEKELLDNYKSELGIEIKNLDYELHPINKTFTTKMESHILLLELLGLSVADDDFDSSEKTFINNIIEELGISHEKTSQMLSWLKKQNELYIEIHNILEN